MKKSYLCVALFLSAARARAEERSPLVYEPRPAEHVSAESPPAPVTPPPPLQRVDSIEEAGGGAISVDNFEFSSRPSRMQTVHLMAGPFRPVSLAITNGTYNFNYSPNSLNSFLVEGGWSASLFHFLGGFELQTDLAGTSFQGTAQATRSLGEETLPLTLRMAILSVRGLYAADWFPWHALIPFVEGGYQYAFYYQSGNADLESASGTVGNAVAGAGLRLWLNRSSESSPDQVKRFSSYPMFLTAKVSRIYGGAQAVNLASTYYLAGISIGI